MTLLLCAASRGLRCSFTSLKAVPLAALSLALFSLAGCGEVDELNRQAVSGTITFDGEPLAEGSISFSPANGVDGPGAGAAIAGGDYALPRERGLPPGKYTIRINAAQGGTPDPNTPPGPPGEAPVAKELVPPSWNRASKHEVEVVDGGSNDFSFDVKSTD